MKSINSLLSALERAYLLTTSGARRASSVPGMHIAHYHQTCVFKIKVFLIRHEFPFVRFLLQIKSKRNETNPKLFPMHTRCVRQTFFCWQFHSSVLSKWYLIPLTQLQSSSKSEVKWGATGIKGSFLVSGLRSGVFRDGGGQWCRVTELKVPSSGTSYNSGGTGTEQVTFLKHWN